MCARLRHTLARAHTHEIHVTHARAHHEPRTRAAGHSVLHAKDGSETDKLHDDIWALDLNALTARARARDDARRL